VLPQRATPTAPPIEEEPALAIWLQRRLRDSYGNAVAEPVPAALLRLLG